MTDEYLDLIRAHAYNYPIHLYDIQRDCLIDRDGLIEHISSDIAYANVFRFQKSTELSLLDGDISMHINRASQYAILSHRWEEEELSFGDVDDRQKMNRKLGYQKFKNFCIVASRDYRCRFVWIDTLCINKASSAELEESIQSMYTWYQRAHVCLVYLTSQRGSFSQDMWFERGWTLQELLAPRRVKFFWANWQRVEQDSPYDIDHVASGCLRGYLSPDDDDFDLHARPTPSPAPIKNVPSEGFLIMVALTAGIDRKFLEEYYRPSPSNASIVFHWAARRATTRPEDMAYCLFGLLKTRVSVMYGEGKSSAFYRLQVACAQATEDRRLFTWHGRPSSWNSMLAHDPKGFTQMEEGELRGCGQDGDVSFAFTNYGLRIAVMLYDITEAVTTQVSDTYPGPKFHLSIWLSEESRQLPPSAEFTLTKGAHLLATDVSKYYVAVIGHYGERPYALLLERHDGQGRLYTRFPTARFMNFRHDLVREPTNIFIK